MPILDWLNRAETVKVAEQIPYRLIEAIDDLSAGNKDSPNMVIQGDNLEALKALRNRIAHHEPVWNGKPDPADVHKSCVSIVLAMSIEAYQHLASIDRFAEVREKGGAF